MHNRANVQVKVRELALKHLARQPGEEQERENRDSKAAQQQSAQSGAGLLEGGFGPGGFVGQDAGKYSAGSCRRKQPGGVAPTCVSSNSTPSMLGGGTPWQAL